VFKVKSARLGKERVNLLLAASFWQPLSKRD
jgi:hypothetical protein